MKADNCRRIQGSKDDYRQRELIGGKDTKNHQFDDCSCFLISLNKETKESNETFILLFKHCAFLTLFENYSKCPIRILAFSTNFCPIKTALSGNTV